MSFYYYFGGARLQEPTLSRRFKYPLATATDHDPQTRIPPMS